MIAGSFASVDAAPGVGVGHISALRITGVAGAVNGKSQRQKLGKSRYNSSDRWNHVKLVLC